MKGYDKGRFDTLRSVLSETKRNSEKVRDHETQENVDAFNLSLAKLRDCICEYAKDIIHPPMADEDFELYKPPTDDKVEAQAVKAWPRSSEPFQDPTRMSMYPNHDGDYP